MKKSQKQTRTLVPPDPQDSPPRLLILYEYPDRTTRRCNYQGEALHALLARDDAVAGFLRRLIFSTKDSIEKEPLAPRVWDQP